MVAFWSRRRALVAAGLVVAGWVAFSHFVVRPRLHSFLASTFEGEVKVPFAILWPHLDATAFGVEVVADRFRLGASRVTVGLRPFGRERISRIVVAGLEADLLMGAPVHLVRGGEAGAPDGRGSEPVRIPPLTFLRPELAVRDRDGPRHVVVEAEEARVVQDGERTFRLECIEGSAVRVPFEKLTARLLPRGDRVIVENLKARAFHGMLAGTVDVDTSRAGAANGEIEWRFVEVEEIWRTYGLPYSEQRRGDCSGRLVFEALRPESDALRARGEARLERAHFHSPVSFRVFLVLGLPALEDSWVRSAEMDFSCEEGLLYLERGLIRGDSYELDAQGLVSFDGQADLEVDYAGTTLAVRGRLEDPTVKVLPLNAVTLPFDRLFRERIRERKGE